MTWLLLFSWVSKEHPHSRKANELRLIFMLMLNTHRKKQKKICLFAFIATGPFFFVKLEWCFFAALVHSAYVFQTITTESLTSNHLQHSVLRLPILFLWIQERLGSHLMLIKGINKSDETTSLCPFCYCKKWYVTNKHCVKMLWYFQIVTGSKRLKQNNEKWKPMIEWHTNTVSWHTTVTKESCKVLIIFLFLFLCISLEECSICLRKRGTRGCSYSWLYKKRES